MIYNYLGYWECKSKCDIEIHGNVVIATEINENRGTSITNAAEVLANKVCEEYSIDKANLMWIEHYKRDESYNDDYSLVNFVIYNNELISPAWKYLTKEQVEDIIKSARKE